MGEIRLESSRGLSRLPSVGSYQPLKNASIRSQFTFFANGHTIPCEAFSNDPKLQDFSYILVVEEPPNSPRIDIPWSTGEQVTLLWAVPITADEQERAKEHGSRKLLTGLSPDHSPQIIGSRSSCDS
ncbi:suppressor of fused domain protein [Akkermansiaceae bacterium]|nr:suppressor of fused domain protein [Akkermansiaceae bacterium]MDA7908266.1 suppressor of fused domain protein [Akkermansiaceae bacterium]MDB4465629.1 suppressor of fused domain protein [Akkermansiaceae bacterium]